MKHSLKRMVSLLLVLVMVLSLGACGKKEAEIDATAVLKSLLTQVQFDTEMVYAEGKGEIFFPGLPEGSQVLLYNGSGYFADELVLLALPSAKDTGDAMPIVETHLEELHNQFISYVPEEVTKIDNAVIREIGRLIFVVLTRDTEGVTEILDHAEDPTYLRTSTPPEALPQEEQPQLQPTEDAPAAEPESESQEQAQQPAELNAAGYPKLQSSTGSYYDYGTGAIRVDNAAYETYGYLDDAATQYTGLVSKVADELAGTTTVYALPIPTTIGIVLPDDIAPMYPDFPDQNQAITKILDKMSDNVNGINAYKKLMQHRNEYLYFRTDYHWNGRGAYYAYEAFCDAKGVAPYTLDQRTQRNFDGFLGQLYWNNADEDPAIGNTPDIVETFSPKSNGVTMEFTDKNGQTMAWDIIADVSGWAASTKYNTFAGADNPMTVFTNPEVTDGSVLVVVKESYGNAMLPLLVDHYSTVYEIDYRYWDGNIAQFAAEKQADDLLFANNLSMIGSNLLIGMLAKNVN